MKKYYIVTKKGINYFVWMYNEEIIKEFISAKHSDYTSKYNNINKPFKLKLGAVDFEELEKANKYIKKENEDEYFIVYVQANVEGSKTLIVEDDLDKMNDFSNSLPTFSSLITLLLTSQRTLKLYYRK